MSKSKKLVSVVALSGKRGVGKSTLAEYLVRKYGYQRVSFGAALKEYAKHFFPFTDDDFSEANKEKPYTNRVTGENYDWSPRDFLIALGQMARFFDENFWVKAAGIEKLKGRIVIDDMRFPNEMKYLKGLDAVTVRIERSEKLNIYGKNLDNISETALDKAEFDHRIESCRNRTRSDLYDAADYVMELIREK